MSTFLLFLLGLLLLLYAYGFRIHIEYKKAEDGDDTIVIEIYRID